MENCSFEKSVSKMKKKKIFQHECRMLSSSPRYINSRSSNKSIYNNFTHIICYAACACASFLYVLFFCFFCYLISKIVSVCSLRLIFILYQIYLLYIFFSSLNSSFSFFFCCSVLFILWNNLFPFFFLTPKISLFISICIYLSTLIFRFFVLPV